MPKRLHVLFALVAITTTSWFVSGCSRNTQDTSDAHQNATAASDGVKGDYDPHDVPITEEQQRQLQEATAQFGDAVAKIKEFRDALEKETKGGIPAQPYHAHQALDKLDLVLQWMPQIARDSGVAKAHWEEINTAANDLRTSFEQIHQRIDSKQDPDFASEAKEIDQKMSRLEQIASGHGAADKTS